MTTTYTYFLALSLTTTINETRNVQQRSINIYQSSFFFLSSY